MTKHKSQLGLLVGAFLLATALYADRSQIEGEVGIRPVDSLEKAWEGLGRSSETRWVGWTIDAVAESVVHRGRCQVSLGEERHSWRNGDATSSTSSTGKATLFFEIRGGRLSDLMIAQSECAVDARGVELELWEGVTAEESLRVLSQSFESAGPELRAELVSAMAQHRLSAVDPRLETIASDDGDEDVRHAALFWLGSVRGFEGYLALRNLEDQLSVSDLEEALVFWVLRERSRRGDGATLRAGSGTSERRGSWAGSVLDCSGGWGSGNSRTGTSRS